MCLSLVPTLLLIPTCRDIGLFPGDRYGEFTALSELDLMSTAGEYVFDFAVVVLGVRDT